MTRDEIKAALTAVMLTLFELEETQIIESASLYDDLDVDSIDMLDLLLSIKQETAVELDFEPEDFRDVRTFGDLLDVLERLT